MFFRYSIEGTGYILLKTTKLFINRSAKFEEDIFHAPLDELVRNFPSPQG